MDEHINPGGDECPHCGRRLRPAPARFEGEDTFCGFMPCVCSWTAYLDRRHDSESWEEYRERINQLVCPLHGYADQCDCDPKPTKP